MLESMIAVLGPRMGEALQAHHQPPRHGNENPMRVPAGLFECGDGQMVNFIVQNQAYWAPFCRALEREEWIEDPRFDSMVKRVENRDEINAVVRARLKDEPASVWMERLLAHRVPCGPYYDYVAALNEKHVRERGLVVEVEHPVSGTIELVGPPWVSTLGQPPLTPPPLLGEHADQVLTDWLGREQAELFEFAEAARKP
jgi:crotonobetainyl-CoA:carnitine CoA-transferase CaiB-like acyl-CoA transferase